MYESKSGNCIMNAMKDARSLRPKKKIAVLMGGPSSEHEVSLKSGAEVLRNLNAKKYQVIPITVDKRGLWLIKGPKAQPVSEPEAILQLQRERVGLVFVAMHGQYGEDGTVQAILHKAGLPFTGSRALSSALAMNKNLASRHLREYGFNVPEYEVIHVHDWNRGGGVVIRSIAKKFGFPVVVKPVHHGSSVGVSIVREPGDLRFSKLRRAMDLAFTFDKHVMAQKFIQGREVTCAVLEYRGTPTALLPTEIIPVKSEFFDYAAKYTKGGSREVTPPKNMRKELVLKIQRAAERAHALLGCSGYSRTDMILGNEGVLYFLETNTLPGLTQESLLPGAALASGIKFPKLLDLIIDSALHSA